MFATAELCLVESARMYGSLTAPFLRRSKLVALALSAQVWIAALQHAQGQAVGAWTNTWNWQAQLNIPTTCSQDIPEFAHAALISTGQHAGKVLLWRDMVDASCASTFTTQAWLFDSSCPDFLIEIDSRLTSDIFCAGHSWDKNGELLVAGGWPQPAGVPNQTWRFRPTSLGAIVNPCSPSASIPVGSTLVWKRMGGMVIPRYYPTVVPLDRRPVYGNAGTGCSNTSPMEGGSNLVAGGPPTTAPPPGQTYSDHNEFLEVMRATLGPLTPWYCPIIPDSLAMSAHYAQYIQSTGVPYDQYDRLPTGNEPDVRLESYPRMVQLSSGEILVVGDADSYNVYPVNTAGSSWAIAPQYNGPGRWQLHRGPTASPPTNSNPWHNSFYDSVVVLHEPVSTTRLNRVIVFGGSRPINACSPQYDWQVNNQVWEFQSIAGSAVNGSWRAKTADALFKRVYANAVVLPTGEILLTGGTSEDDTQRHCCTCSGGSSINYAVPVDNAVIYHPGSQATDPGTWTVQLANTPQSGQTISTPRLYHHVALLLPDARVFIAGGHLAHLPSGLSPESRFTGEVFSPPYLHSSVGFRPAIASFQSSIAFSTSTTPQQFSVTVVHQIATPGGGPGHSIDRLVLLRSPSVTHHFDSDQRYIELDFETVESYFDEFHNEVTSSLNVVAPQETLGAPGWYMLFVIESDGTGQTGHRVPSLGKFVQLQ